MPGGYQVQIFNQPAQGVPGDFATANPRASFLAGPGGLVAGPNGVVVGGFAWVTPPTDPDGTDQIVNSFGTGNVAGFVWNDLEALNTVFLSDATLVIPQGLPVPIAIQGDFLVINNGTTEAQVGMKAYANFANGQASFAAAGSPSVAAEATGSTVTPETNGWTASIAGDVMTVTAVSSGTLYPGTTITGIGVAPGTMIASQLSGTPGGVGKYLLSVSQQTNIASEAMTGTYGLLTIGTLVGTTPFAVGQMLEVTGSVVAGTSITANVSGAGGSGGTMIVNNNTSLSQTIYTLGNIETKWYAASAAQPGQLVKITSWQGSQG